MRAELNYTDRIDFLPNEVEATYHVVDDKYVLRVKWMLGHYSFPEECTFFAELRGGSSTTEAHRIEFGLLGHGNGDRETELTQVRNPELIKLRFGVVSPEPNLKRRIVGQIDDVVPTTTSESADSRSFLKIVRSTELSVPWRVDFVEDEPILLISDREELFHNLRDSTPLFFPLVLAEVVRQIFEWMAFEEINLESRSAKEWVNFFEGLTCPKGFFDENRSRLDDDQREDVRRTAWAVSEEFAKRHKLIHQISLIFLPEGE